MKSKMEDALTYGLDSKQVKEVWYYKDMIESDEEGNLVKDNLASCPSDTSCKLINDYLEGLCPTLASESFKTAYANLDISKVEEKYKDNLIKLFDYISLACKSGAFSLDIPLKDLDINYLSKISAFQLKKYLESYNYKVIIAKEWKKYETIVGFYINWEKEE